MNVEHEAGLELSRKLVAVENQRDELLIALKEVLHASPASGWGQHNAKKRAADAIAKAEGRTGKAVDERLREAARTMQMTVEQRIERWREQEGGEETEMAIDLLIVAEEELKQLRGVLVAAHAASHALKSYQYGNASTDLAESTARALDAAIAKAEGR